jgi:zinc protease
MRKPVVVLITLLVLAGAVFFAAKNRNKPPGTGPGGTPVAGTPAPWAHDASDIAPDPKVRYGTLENGMRYAVMPHPEPPNRIALRLHVDAGSLHEAEDQRGVAHFLEHMVFNGSRSFPDSSKLIPTMQRLGIAFGAHANAYTSFDETVYMLDLPNLDEDTLKLGFTVMRDFADGALLKEDEIDKERGVILSEKRSRDSVDMRLMEQQFEFLMPDVLITHRFPIGTEEVISNAPRERFTSFYSDYYNPSNITFVVSGDIDPDVIEERIKSTFESFRDPEATGQEPGIGEVPTGTGFRTAVFTDKEVAADELSLTSLRPFTKEPDTVANRVKRLPLTVANAIISRRFDILSKEENSPIKGGSAGRFAWFDAIEFVSGSVEPAEGRWQDAVAVLDQELRRALQFGFTQPELDEIKASLLNSYEQAVKSADTRKSDGTGGLASRIARAVNRGKVFSTPGEDLRIVKVGLETVTLESIHNALRESWDTGDLNLILTTKEAPADTKDTLAQLYTESAAVAVTPPKEEATKAFAYTGFGPAGTIVSDTTVEDLGIRQLVLSNNIRVNLKTTDFQKNSISMTARFGGGKLTMPADKTGLDGFAGMLMNAGGLGQHSVTELQRLLAGRNVGADFGIEEDTFFIAGRTTPDDLELQLQLLCAGLTDPGFREEAVRQYRQILPQIFSQLEHTINGAMAQMEAWTHGGDGRFAVPEQEKLAAFTAEDAKSWLQPSLANDYLEFSMVGEFDPDTAIPIILKTLGALPERAAAKADYSALGKIQFPATPGENSFSYESKIAKAAALVAWKIPALGDNIKETRRLNILASILSDRMREKIREELGASYSPRAGAQPGTGFDYGVLSALSLGKPEDCEPVAKIILEIGEELANNGTTADEVDRAVQPVLGQLETTLRDNSYWLSTVLAQSQEQAHRLDWARQRDADYASITPEDINALAKKYLPSTNALKITLLPEVEAELP